MVYECDAIDTSGIVPSEYHINVLLFQQFPEFLFRFALRMAHTTLPDMAGAHLPSLKSCVCRNIRSDSPVFPKRLPNLALLSEG